MKTTLLGLCLATVAVASDPNRLSLDDAKAYAKPCVEYAATLTDHPFEHEVDGDRPCAVRGEGGGGMVVPEKRLTLARVQGAGKEVVPVGQLWLRKWTVMVKGKPAGEESLRMLDVKFDDKSRPMPMLLLGVRKGGPKGLELVLCARDREPLLAVPLEEFGKANELPLEMEWQRGEKKEPDTLTIGVLGKYRAIVPIGRLGK